MITIVGGGLAGLSLGIALRRRGVPVNFHEAGVYPRHRVCGEFISGVSQCTFDSLGIGDLFDDAKEHRSTAWFFRDRRILSTQLPGGLGISRFALDERLSRKFRETRRGPLRALAANAAKGRRVRLVRGKNAGKGPLDRAEVPRARTRTGRGSRDAPRVQRLCGLGERGARQESMSVVSSDWSPTFPVRESRRLRGICRAGGLDVLAKRILRRTSRCGILSRRCGIPSRLAGVLATGSLLSEMPGR